MHSDGMLSFDSSHIFSLIRNIFKYLLIPETKQKFQVGGSDCIYIKNKRTEIFLVFEK